MASKGAPHLPARICIVRIFLQNLSKLSDRLEVVLSCECGSNPGEGKASLGGVDRVQHETQGNVVITRLTKFINQGAPSR